MNHFDSPHIIAQIPFDAGRITLFDCEINIQTALAAGRLYAVPQFLLRYIQADTGVIHRIGVRYDVSIEPRPFDLTLYTSAVKKKITELLTPWFRERYPNLLENDVPQQFYCPQVDDWYFEYKLTKTERDLFAEVNRYNTFDWRTVLNRLNFPYRQVEVSSSALHNRVATADVYDLKMSLGADWQLCTTSDDSPSHAPLYATAKLPFMGSKRDVVIRFANNDRELTDKVFLMLSTQLFAAAFQQAREAVLAPLVDICQIGELENIAIHNRL